MIIMVLLLKETSKETQRYQCYMRNILYNDFDNTRINKDKRKKDNLLN